MLSRLIFFWSIWGLIFSAWIPGLVSTRPNIQTELPSTTETFLPIIPSYQIHTPDSNTTATEDLISGRLLPDLQTLPPKDLQLFQEASSKRTYLRFTNSIWNSGPGKLELIGTPNQAKDQIWVSQLIFGADPEVFSEFEVGEFRFHDQHDHWHLEGFAVYEVWSLDERGSLESMVSTGGKVSYCVMDVSLAETSLVDGIVPKFRTYTHCEGIRQGLSIGWIDTYKYFYPGQSVEVSSLKDGIYALVSTVDPDHLLKEANIHNNSAVAYFEIREKNLKRADYLFIEEEGKPHPR